MKKRKLFRTISLAMFVIAVIFVGIAVTNPQLGHVIYIGDYAFGADEWRVCYAIYAVVMAALFGASFFAKD